MNQLVRIFLVEVFFVLKLSDKFVKETLQFVGMVLFTIIIQRSSSQRVYTSSTANFIKEAFTLRTHKEQVRQ